VWGDSWVPSALRDLLPPKGWRLRKAGGLYRQTKYGYARIERVGEEWRTVLKQRSRQGRMYGGFEEMHSTRQQAFRAGEEWLSD